MSPRARKLLKKISFSYTKVLRVFEGRDFCEFDLYGSGDTVTYRVYDSGEVVAR